MSVYLLDSVAFIQSIPLAFILLLLVWGVIEGFILSLFHINKFLRAVIQAAFVNLVSLILCFLLLYISERDQWSDYTSVDLEASNEIAWLALFLISALIETLLLKALNKSAGWIKLLMVCLFMNLVTFAIFYVYVFYNQ